MNINKKLGNKLRVLREVHNYTQEYVSNVLDVAPSTYSLMEKGQAQITIERIEKLASLYKMDISDLLKLSDQTIIQQHFTYSNGISESVTINNNGLAEDERKMYKEVIQQLREQNNKLEEQNERLLHLLEKLSETK